MMVRASRACSSRIVAARSLDLVTLAVVKEVADAAMNPLMSRTAMSY